MKSIFLILSLFSSIVFSVDINPKPYNISVVPVEYQPAFCNLIKNPLLTGTPSEPVYDLIISSFSGNP